MESWHRDVTNIFKGLERTEWLNKEELVELQRLKLRKLCKSAYNNAKHYRKVFDEASIDPETINIGDLKNLPILEKKTIRQNFHKILNERYPKDRLKKNATGGSSGEPLTFYNTIWSGKFSAALFIRGMRWTGTQFGDLHVKLWGAPTDIKKAIDNLKPKVWNYIYNRKLIDAFNLNEELFENIYESFSKCSPVLLESYSNILYEFARYLKTKGKKPLSIPSVISSAGVLYDFQRETIQDIISQNIFNRYGSREFGNIAQECSFHTGMHINMEKFIIEIDKPDQKNSGDILVTDLENHAFPFIRYKIGDMGQIATKECECGRKSIMFEKVVGRSLDIVKTLSGKMISGEMFPHFFKDFPQIILGQVVQDRKDHLEIRLKLKPDSSLSDINPLIKKIEDATEHEMKITLNTEKNFITNPTGKYRPVISTVE